MSELSTKTKVSVDLVIYLVSMALSTGIMWQKMNGIEKEVSRLTDKVFPISITESADSTRLTQLP